MRTHLKNRTSRYYINSEKSYFKDILKGLTTVELCITEMCTRKCGFCPRSDESVYKNNPYHMSIETVLNFADKCVLDNFGGDVHISGFGEPFLNKNIFEIVRTLKKSLPENRVCITNNGDCLSKEKIKDIFECGLDYMIISCYDGEESKNKFLNMFQELDISDEKFEIRELWFKPKETELDFAKRNNFNNRSGTYTKLNELGARTGKCYLPFYKLVIDWNGEVLLCCNDWYRRHRGFGNINKDTLFDIWNGDEFKKVREQLSNGNRVGPSCKNCSIDGTLIGKESVKMLGF